MQKLILVSVCWLLLAAHAFAQSSSAPLAQPAATQQQANKVYTYETVSIKPSDPKLTASSKQNLRGAIAWTNTPLFSLLQDFYGVYMDDQFLGLPDWVKEEKYDIMAKADTDTVERWGSLPRDERSKVVNRMMQSILIDRCRLEAHEETRELPVYELVIAKGGLKLKEAPPDEPFSARISRGRMTAHAMKISTIVGQFGGTDGRMVIDKTGLGDTKYDFDLTWTPNSTPNDQRATAADAPPSIYTALEEQLGLKLVPAKSPLKVVIVDHIERPSPN
jgi:uncharacterized protein (TIGR03435 family)